MLYVSLFCLDVNNNQGFLGDFLVDSRFDIVEQLQNYIDNDINLQDFISYFYKLDIKE